jgi:hypothetical protein
MGLSDANAGPNLSDTPYQQPNVANPAPQPGVASYPVAWDVLGVANLAGDEK